MKTLKTYLILSLLVSSAMFTFADDTKYAEVMAKNIQTVYNSQILGELQQAVNTFERIGSAEKTKWEPYYYAGFGYIMMANYEKDGAKKDLYLDQAASAINKAKAILPNDSEIIALEGFVHMIRVTVDPASRGQQYSGMAMQTFGKAISLNPENPRALALMAQMQLGTAEFLGSSTAEACGMNKAALQKFLTFKPNSPLAPQWGKAMAERVSTKCKE
jgi:tetratricopeptide (TPR) repeat protein